MSERDWQYYRDLAIGYQNDLRICEARIDEIWQGALVSAQGDKRAAWVTHLKKEESLLAYEFSSLKGDRALLLAKITAAAAMGTMLRP